LGGFKKEKAPQEGFLDPWEKCGHRILKKRGNTLFKKGILCEKKKLKGLLKSLKVKTPNSPTRGKPQIPLKVNKTLWSPFLP